MLSYKNQLRMAVLAARGVVDVAALTSETDVVTDLDRRIIQLAGRRLAKSEKTAFFYAYHCQPSWEDIQMCFKDHLNKEVQIETVQRYGDRAAGKIIAEAASAKEFKV